MSDLGSARHRALIGEIVAFYERDDRIRAVAVFGSVGAGNWHELSDVDLDVVIADDTVIAPEQEVEALFGERAKIVLVAGDAADVVLGSLEELSIRWHPLATTSPNIARTVRVVSGTHTDQEVQASAQANQTSPDQQRLLDELVRAAVGAAKAIRRHEPWTAVVAVQEMRDALLLLRGYRDSLRLDPADPAGALVKVLDETRASFDLGPVRSALLNQISDHRASYGTATPTG